MLRAGKTQIGLNQDDWKKGRDRKKGIGVRLSISTTPDNVDEIAKRARNAGITLKSDPHDTEWKPRVRGHRSERFPADHPCGDIGVSRTLGQRRRRRAIRLPTTDRSSEESIKGARAQHADT